MRELVALENDETLLVQSGKPVAVFRIKNTRRAFLIANPILSARGPTGEHYELERRGLMMQNGQMTSGNWIYIGHRHRGHV